MRTSALASHSARNAPSSPTDPLSQREKTRHPFGTSKPYTEPHIQPYTEPQSPNLGPFNFQKKRGLTTPEHTIRYRPFIQGNRTLKKCLLEARELIIEASSSTNTFEEQSKILDLLEIIREYTEKD